MGKLMTNLDAGKISSRLWQKDEPDLPKGRVAENKISELLSLLSSPAFVRLSKFKENENGAPEPIKVGAGNHRAMVESTLDNTMTRCTNLALIHLCMLHK